MIGHISLIQHIRIDMQVDHVALFGERSDGAAEIPLSFTLRPVRVPTQTRLRWFRSFRGDKANG